MKKPGRKSNLQQIIFRLLFTRQVIFSLVIALVIIGASYYSGQKSIEDQGQAAYLLAQRAGDYYDSASRVMHALAGMSLKQENLEAVQRAYQIFDVLYLMDSDGRLLATAPKSSQSLLGMDLSAQPFFIPNSKDIVISTPFTSPRTGNPTVYLSMPIDGQKGVVVGELSLLGLEASIIQVNPHPTNVFSIIDQAGDLLAHPQYERVQRQENIRLSGIYDQIQEGKYRQINFIDGQWVYTAISVVPQTGWMVIVQAPLLEVYRPFLVPAFIGLLLASTLFLVSIYQEKEVIANEVISPLSQLEQAAQQLTQGEFDTSFLSSQSAAYQEVGSLAESFERMRQAIKARQDALRESEERWQFALEGAGDGVWDLNLITDQVFFSRQWKAIVGYADEEIEETREEWARITHPDDLHQINEDVESHIRGETEVFSSEHRLRRKDVSYVWVLTRGKVIQRDQDGNPVRMIGTLSDISRRKQMENALRESEERLRLITDSMSDMICLHDLDSSYIYVSPSSQALTGHTTADLIGKTPYDFFHPDDRENVLRKSHEQALTEDATQLVTYRFRKKDGSYTWFESLVKPIVGEDGQPLFIQSTSRDINERIKAQSDLAAASHQLELKNEQLEQLNADKDKLFSIIAHDLRTPLSSFIAFGSLLDTIDEMDKETVDRLLFEYHASADRLMTLLDNLLTWARSQRGMIEFHPTVFKISQSVDENIELLGQRAKQKFIGLRNSIPPDLQVYADPFMVNRVLSNLITNSIKFSQPGGVVEITGCEVRDMVEISVTDQGIGMPEEIRASVFTVGTKTKQLGTAGEKGTGLGLILCKEFVEKNGGTIWVISRPDIGSRFTFTLPANVENL